MQSLDILRKRVPNPYFKAALDDVYERVRSGSALSEAFEAQKLFSGVYTASLMAGEKSGSLEQVIRRYVQHIKVLAAVRGTGRLGADLSGRPRRAVDRGRVGLIVFKVVPEFAEFYASWDTAPSCRCRRGSSWRFRRTSSAVRGGFSRRVAALVALVVFVASPAGAARAAARVRSCGCRTSGRWRSKFATAQVSRTLATLLSGGIPLVNALDIAAQVGRQSSRSPTIWRSSPGRSAKAAAWPGR